MDSKKLLLSQFLNVHLGGLFVVAPLESTTLVDKSKDHAKPHSIFFYHNIKDSEINIWEKSNDAYSLLIRVQTHSRPQRPRSFWSAPRIATSGLLQRHSVFEWLSKHNRLRPEPIRFVKLDSEHAQSDGKSVNRGLPVLDLARGRDSWC